MKCSKERDRSLGEMPVEMVGWAIETASRQIPLVDTCLPKAMTAVYLLRRAGNPAVFCVGVSKAAPDRFSAHAWVEMDGRIVIGSSAAEKNYVPLLDIQCPTRAVSLVLIFLGMQLLSSVAYAVDFPGPPSGSGAEVVSEKFKNESEEKLKKERWTPKMSLEEDEPEETASSDQTEFYIRKIHLEGNTLIPEKDIQGILSAFEERNQTMAGLNAVCKALELEFQNRGYFVVVYLPPQRIENQEAILKIAASKMGELHLEGAHYFSQKRTLSYWKIPKGEVLVLDDIRTNVLRMNENPDRNVKLSLKAGAEPSTTDVYLQQTDEYPFHSSVSLDNQGAKLTGKDRPGLSFRHNNFYGYDDVLYVGTSLATEMMMLYVNHQLPLPQWGVRLVTYFSRSRVTPKKEFETFHLTGDSTDFGLQIRRWLFVNDRASLEAYAGFSVNEKRTRALAQVVTRDKLRSPSVGLDFQSADEAGFWNLGGSVSTGLANNDDSVALTSRQAGSSFSKISGLIRRVQRLATMVTGVLSLRGQWSPDSLTPQQQIFMGGADSVRGYPESDYGGDYGCIGNAEIRTKPFFIPESIRLMNFKESLKQQTDLIFFYDYGYGHLVDPSDREHRSRNLSSVGFGFNFNFRDNLKAIISYGYAIGDQPLTESGKSQVHFKVESTF